MIDLDKFFKEYNYNPNLLYRIAGISPSSIDRYKEGKKIRARTKLLIETIVGYIIENDIVYPDVKTGFDCRYKKSYLEARKIRMDINEKFIDLIGGWRSYM